MGFFEKLKEKARKDPRVVVLPEVAVDKDGVIKEAIRQVKTEGTAIPIGLTPEIIADSGKRDAFVEAYASRKGYGDGLGDGEKGRGLKIAERVLKRLPAEVFFADMMVDMGYADGVVAGRYITSADIAMTAKLVVGEQEGQIVSSIFFRQPPEGYPLFDLIAIADMVANQNPNAAELYKIIVTSATTFEDLTGIAPKIAILSYITGRPQAVQITRDPELAKIEAALELYAKGGHKWPICQAQMDAALDTSVAKRKGAPFTDRPADLLIGPSLMLANPMYKALERLILGGQSMFITQGFKLPIMDLSRGDSAANIANVVAACSVRARMAEQTGGKRKTDKFFLKYAS
jgi:phosphate acetyltransferase